MHPCVQCKLYLAKSFNGDLIGPEIAENIEQEYQSLMKQLDEKSDILALFETRKVNKNGSIRPIGMEEYKKLQIKYSLDPLIKDTDMAAFMIIDHLLADYPLAQKVAKERLEQKMEERSALGSTTSLELGDIFLGQKEEKNIQRATDLRLGSIF